MDFSELPPNQREEGDVPLVSEDAPTENIQSGEPKRDPDPQSSQGIGIDREAPSRLPAVEPFVVVPKPLPSAEERRSGKPGHDPNAERDSFNQGNEISQKVSECSLGAIDPSVCIASAPSGLNDQTAGDKPSIGKRIVRRFARFFVTALISVFIGIAASSAWEHWEPNSDKVVEMVRTLAPSLGLFPSEWQFRSTEANRIVRTWTAALVSRFSGATKSALSVNSASKQTRFAPAGQMYAQDDTRPQSAPLAQKPASAEVPISSELAQQLEGMARDLIAMRQKVEQLAAAQDQMAHNVASLETADRNISQKMAAPSPLSAAPVPPRKNAPRVELSQPTPQLEIAPQASEQQDAPDEQGENAQLPARLRRQVVDHPSREAPGTIIIDTPHTFLYYVLGHGKAIRYGIGVGRQGYTWSGVNHVARKTEWPDWYPPPEMIARQPYLPRMVAGGSGNPLGARALYIGNTEYRIHGTNDPSSIGKFMSSGCIRLTNDNIVDLYNRVGVGAKVIVLPMPMMFSDHQ